jgi:hypothetical protein
MRGLKAGDEALLWMTCTEELTGLFTKNMARPGIVFHFVDE